MNGADAADELQETVVEYCKKIKADPPDSVRRVALRGDGNLGGCDIRFDHESDMNEISLWGGHQFEMGGRDADYGPAEVEVATESKYSNTRQVSTFGPADDFDDQSDFEWAEIDGRSLLIRGEHSMDEGETIEVSL